ncbi:MAG: hypothetical protein WD767_19755 [Alphaproteobacteria bacterium]
MAVGCTVLFIAVIYAGQPFLASAWQTAGSVGLYWVGVAGAAMLFVPAAYAFVKRGGNAVMPRRWLVAHIVAGVSGAVLVTIHGAGGWTRPPAILVLLVYFLIIQGAWARSIGSAKLARVMASRSSALRAERPVDKVALRRILDAKTKLLKQLDPAADEALFSPNRSHWFRHPFLTFAYVRLSHREAIAVGARGTVGRDLGNWRRLHLLAAGLLIGGIAVHVITVTFFAGYVADGGPITWWHLAAWGG